jgi:hypothetical protein
MCSMKKKTFIKLEEPTYTYKIDKFFKGLEKKQTKNKKYSHL